MGKNPPLGDDLRVLKTLSPEQLQALFRALLIFYIYRYEDRGVAIRLGKKVVKAGSQVLMEFILPIVLNGELSLDEVRDLLVVAFGFNPDQAVAIIEPIKPGMPQLRNVAIFHLVNKLASKLWNTRENPEDDPRRTSSRF
jgi:hypothetical protein